MSDLVPGVGPGRPIGQRVLSPLERMSPMANGVSLDEAAVAFRVDVRTIKKRCGSVKPCGKRGKADVYYIHELAPHLVKPVGDFEAFMRSASPRDMPPLLTKEYWNGQRARQAALENEGELWRTDRIVEKLGRVFKTLRTSLLLIPDELERKTSLSEGARSEVKAMLDSALERARDELIGEFGEEPGPDDRPGTILSQPDYGDIFADPEEDDDLGGPDTSDAVAERDEPDPYAGLFD